MRNEYRDHDRFGANSEALTVSIAALKAAMQSLSARAPGAVESIRRIAHSLRSSCGLPDISKAALALQESNELDIHSHLEQLLAKLTEITAHGIAKVPLLVVTGDADLSDRLRKNLSSVNRQITAVESGAQAERILTEQEISLVLLDLELADVDGRNLLVQVRERPGTAEVPVIVMTDVDDPAQASECFALGADAYFKKPLDLQTVAARVSAELLRAADLKLAARRDILTGLPNRAAFLETLGRAIASAVRTHRWLSVAMLDLDHFKGVNDSYGHATGDRVLRTAARVIAQSLRASDVLARWGGEEFVASFPDTDQESATRVLERALHALREEQFETEDGRVFQVTFSAGVIEVSGNLAVEEAVSKADELLYLAKAAGRNRVVTTQDTRAEQGGSVTTLGTNTNTEQRQITVMELGLTKTSEQLAAVRGTSHDERLSAYREACSAVIQRFDGFIAQDRNESLRIYFGYPRAHEDDGQRAVRAGIEIVEATKRLAADLESKESAKLSVSVGIHTGPVVVEATAAGEQERVNEDDTQYIAAQMQVHAAPGTVVMSAATAGLVHGIFACEELGVQPISQPMVVYRVLQESSAHGRFDLTTDSGLTPLTGRQTEMALLQERWQQAVDGMGQVVLLSGEAGIGKSRLVHALKSHAADVLHTSLECRCSNYHTQSAFYPLLDLLQRVLQLDDSENTDVKIQKIETMLSRYGLVPYETVPLLASMLGLTSIQHRYPPSNLTPQQYKQKALEAGLTMFLELAAEQPVLLIVEDLHWVDSSTLEFLSLLVDQAPTMRLFMLCTARPAFRSPWNSRANLSHLTLNRLSREQVDNMLTPITGGKALPPEVHEHLLSKTDGVPLFVEELTKMVLESGLLREGESSYELTGPLPNLAIPTTLHDSLMARLDRLGSAKVVAQIAATLGRHFSYELLHEVSSLEEPALRRALEQLVAAELLYQRHVPPRSTYQFKHALIQETAYQSLVTSARQSYHARIADVLAESFPDVAEKEPEMLAHHYREAAAPERAIPYSIAAGDAAGARYSSEEARAYYQDALEMAGHLPPSEAASGAQIQSVVKLASVAANREQFETDLENLEQAHILAETINDPQRLCEVQYWIGRTNYVLGRFDLGVAYAEKSLAIAEELGGDDKVTSGPVNLLARIHCLRGEARKARDHAARNVEQMHKLGNRVEEAAVSGVLAFAHGLHGQFALAREAADRGVEVAQGIGHVPTLAACFMFRAVAKGWYGELQSSVSDFEKAMSFCDEAGDVFRKYLCHGWRGEAYLLEGKGESAADDLNQCLALGDKIGTFFHRGAFQAFLAKVRLLQGDISGALELSEAALRIATDTAQEWSRSIALRINAEALLRADHPDITRAEAALGTAIDIQEQRECRRDLAWSRLAFGYVLAAKAEHALAEDAFNTAATMFEEMGIARGQERTWGALANLR